MIIAVRTITCFDRVCPAGTDNCKMHRRSTEDRKKIENIVYCLNVSGEFLSNKICVKLNNVVSF